MKIAVDVDSVIFNFVEVFLNIFNHKYKTNYKKSDITKWEFFKDWGIPETQVFEIFYQIYDEKLPAPLIDDKIPTYLKEINKNHHVDILSARNSSFKSQLKGQLNYHNIIKKISYQNIILVNEKPYDVKLQYDYDIYIDDSPNLVEPIKKIENKILMLFEQPWNKDSISGRNIKRIKYWEQIPIEINRVQQKIADNIN